jgi:hypothetical protein
MHSLIISIIASVLPSVTILESIRLLQDAKVATFTFKEGEIGFYRI